MSIDYSRDPKNSAENAFAKQVKYAKLQKRGWPDFICFKDDEIYCVEVKPSASQPLEIWQYRVMKALNKKGIPCFKWSPDGGYKSIADIGEDRI